MFGSFKKDKPGEIDQDFEDSFDEKPAVKDEQQEEGCENILKLTKPIMIMDEEVRELEYDFEALTAKNMHEVSKELKSKGISVTIPSLDHDFLTLTFAKAVQKKMKDVFLTDIFRMSAKDLMKATGLARNFLLDADKTTLDLTSGD